MKILSLEARSLARIRKGQLDQTRRQLADRLGVDPATVYRWESGRSPIPPAYLALVEILGHNARSVKARRALSALKERTRATKA